MKKLIISLSAILCLSSCSISPIGFNIGTPDAGKGPLVDKVYAFNFNGIEQDNGIESDVYHSTENKIIVNAPNDIVENILVESKDKDNIWIHVKKGSNISTSKVKVKIYTRELKLIDASSGSSVSVKDSFISDKLILESTSGANIEGYFKSLSSHIKSSSGSTIKATILGKSIEGESTSGFNTDISGIAQTAILKASSGSTLDGSNLLTSEVNTEVSSGGSLKVSATQKAVAKASSGGSIDIYKKGNDFSINKQESSGGSVEIK